MADPKIVQAHGAAIEAGLSGVFDALRGLATHFVQTTQAAQLHAGPETGEMSDRTLGLQASQSGRRFTIGGAQAQAVFGYAVRVGPEGFSAEPFGDGAEVQPGVPAPRQPITELYQEEDTIIVVMELPGADAADIVCTPSDLEVCIEANGLRHYRKNVVLPCPIDTNFQEKSFNNGILELRLRRRSQL